MEWMIGKITDIDDSEYRKIYENLSASRKSHIDKMKKKNAKKCSLMATHIINCLLIKLGAHNVLVETDEKGKPYLSGSDMFISISHSFDMVACAVGSSPVGIDIEKIKPVSEKLIKFVCTEGEQKYVLEENLTDAEIADRFFMVWTAKEAAFKRNPICKNLCNIDVMNIEKETFLLDKYRVTIVE